MEPIDPGISWLLRAALAALFVSAAHHKLRDPIAFAAVVRAYRLVPEALAMIFARSLGAAEIACAVVLLLPSLDPLGGLAAFGLLALYSLAIAVNLARGRRDIDCGCLGPAGRQPLSGWLLVRNAIAMTASLGVAAGIGNRPLHAVDALTISAGMAMAGLLFSAANRLLSAAPRRVS